MLTSEAPGLAFPPVARTPHKQQPPKTKLAAWRIKRGATQPEMVRDTGIPISSYQRYEAGDYVRLPYQQLVNCAIVLEVTLDELIEDRFKRWTVFDADARRPPKKPKWKMRARN